MGFLIICVLLSEEQLYYGLVQGWHESGWALLSRNKVQSYFGDPTVCWAMCWEALAVQPLTQAPTTMSPCLFPGQGGWLACVSGACWRGAWRLPLLLSSEPLIGGCRVNSQKQRWRKKSLVSNGSGAGRSQRPAGSCSGAQVGVWQPYPSPGLVSRNGLNQRIGLWHFESKRLRNLSTF